MKQLGKLSLILVAPLLTLAIVVTWIGFATPQVDRPPVDLDLLMNSMFDPPRYENYPNREEYIRATGDMRMLRVTDCFRELAERWNSLHPGREPPPDEVLRLPGEEIHVWGCRGVFIGLEIVPSFRLEDVTPYISRRASLLTTIESSFPQHVIEAVVSPARPLTLEEYAEFAKQLTLIWTKYQLVERDTGKYIAGGAASANIEGHVERHHGHINKDRVLVRVLDFKVRTTVYELAKLQKNPLVLLVDIGPLDVVYNYASEGAMIYVKERVGGYLAEWMQYLQKNGQQPTRKA